MRSLYNFILFLILIPLTVIPINSCKSSGVEPAVGDNTPAGRRDYEWTVDTISNLVPNNSYYFLWGTSPTNLWCVGDIEDYDKMILHNDGTGWKVFPHKWDELWVEAWSIFGFTADDFWIGGYYSDMWRYKNGSLDKFGMYNYPGYDNTVITRFWGNTPDDIYATGATYTMKHDTIYATLLHFDGKDWSYTIPPGNVGIYLDIRKNRTNNKYYIKGTNVSNSALDSVGLYEYDGKTVRRIYYELGTNYNWCGMAELDQNLYFGFQKKIFSYKDNNFIKEADLSSYNVYALTKMNGRSIKDFFASADDGIGHYNGTDFTTLYKINNAVITSSIILEKDVYFLCYDLKVKRDYIIHGKLK